MQQPYVAVVGGVNIDLCAKSYAPLIPGDSNPGTVRTSLGGVGRNIAHNMALLGLPVRMVCVLGDDDYARRVQRSCDELGIRLEDACIVPGAATPSYLCIEGPDGDMALAVCDGKLADQLTPEVLQARLPMLCGAAAVVMDTNLPEAAIRFLTEHCTAPIFCDPVSVSKAGKLRGVLGRIHTLKPNLVEAQMLSGVQGDDMASVAQAAQVLLRTGLRRVVISLGARGAYACDVHGGIHIPCCPIELVNATGGGDAMMAALTCGFVRGMSLPDAARLAMAASAYAVEAEETICRKLNYADCARRAGIAP